MKEPTIELKDKSGQVVYQEWQNLDGKPHRLHDPAILRFVNDEVVSAEYFVNGLRHNGIGPAIEHF
jgi:hypothetical protein